MKISLCIIAKNEERVIGRCIDNIKNYVNEIIVIDTGSTDKTIEICKNKGAKVYNFTWTNNFSDARNYALKKASGEWIVFLDADEYIQESDMNVVLNKIEFADKNGYEAIVCKCINLNEDNYTIKSVAFFIRIFKRSKNIRYVGSIHETIMNIKHSIKMIDFTDDINVFHTGYTDSVINEKEKMSRNISLLYNELKKNPDDADIHFYLVESLFIDKRYKEAYEHCNKVISLNNAKNTGVITKVYSHKMKNMILLEYDENEIKKVYDQAVKYDDTYPDYDWIMGMYYGSNGKNEKALGFYEKCYFKINNFNSKIESWTINIVKDIYIDLAKLYRVSNKNTEAVKVLMQVLNVYREDEEALGVLISILRESEEIENIVKFLRKIYNFESDKDILIILKACKSIVDIDLFKYIINIKNNKKIYI